MNVSLTEQEWTTLLNAAALAPFAQIAPVINKITNQLVAQQNAPKAEVEAQSGA